MNKIPALNPVARAWLLEGPLSAHVPMYVARLKRGRYATNTSGRCLNGVAHFVHWMSMCNPPMTRLFAFLTAEEDRHVATFVKIRDGVPVTEVRPEEYDADMEAYMDSVVEDRLYSRIPGENFEVVYSRYRPFPASRPIADRVSDVPTKPPSVSVDNDGASIPNVTPAGPTCPCRYQPLS